ncbi:hypothetical protein E4N63_22765 [Streptomyces sp. MNU89]|nr:hypothetical protein [Streptomyces sp. MNU89]MCC9741720.1 hypothetical protein [Streptomyces sp. MNU89]
MKRSHIGALLLAVPLALTPTAGAVAAPDESPPRWSPSSRPRRSWK